MAGDAERRTDACPGDATFAQEIDELLDAGVDLGTDPRDFGEMGEDLMSFEIGDTIGVKRP